MSPPPGAIIRSIMEKGFEFIDHTADIGIIAHGDTISQVFANAARGLFSIIADLGGIRESERRDIELAAPDRESLLVEWLNHLIYLFDTENIIFTKFDITRLSDTRLHATAYGEKADVHRHRLKTGVKAATYHMLNIEKKDGGYRAQVLFDI